MPRKPLAGQCIVNNRKQCTRCRCDLPLSCFYKRIDTATGFSWWCRECSQRAMNGMRQARREAKRGTTQQAHA